MADEVEHNEADLCGERRLKHRAEEVLLLRGRERRLGELAIAGPGVAAGVRSTGGARVAREQALVADGHERCTLAAARLRRKRRTLARWGASESEHPRAGRGRSAEAPAAIRIATELHEIVR